MATPKLNTDSSLSRRIVSSFLDFLSSVEPAPGVDLEGLEVAKECLTDVFKIDPSVDTKEKQDLLVSLFRSREITEQKECKSDVSNEKLSADAPSTSSARTASHVTNTGTSETPGYDWSGEGPASGPFEDELFGQFFGALERIRYFKHASDGQDDQDQLDRATQFFTHAVMELKRTGCQTVDAKNLAETFKSKGNKSLQSSHYSDAIELYTYALALCEDNAVYYCNRAAAYTQIHKYEEAIRDSLKSIEIDPNYGKAYSRLGFVYYAQGKYAEAIEKGFSKALQLDPNNESVRENILVAQQKLSEQHERNGHYQNFTYSTSENLRATGQQGAGGSYTQTIPLPPFNANGLPADFANMFMNMASNVPSPHGPFPQDDTFSEPEIRVGGGNININLGEQMPGEISGALRSVMQMFSGAAPANQPDNNNNNSSSNNNNNNRNG